jgi:hypothetical protein
MSNEIEAGKRVLFIADPASAVMTPGIVEEVLGHLVQIIASGQTFTRPLSQVKLGTQDTDPAAWMLHDSFTSTPVVYSDGCYICRDPEFAQMGLPLCRRCPECVRQGRGSGHIPADDTECTDCGYEDSPEDYPDPGQDG